MSGRGDGQIEPKLPMLGVCRPIVSENYPGLPLATPAGHKRSVSVAPSGFLYSTVSRPKSDGLVESLALATECSDGTKLTGGAAGGSRCAPKFVASRLKSNALIFPS